MQKFSLTALLGACLVGTLLLSSACVQEGDFSRLRKSQDVAKVEAMKCLNASSGYDFDLVESCIDTVAYLRKFRIDAVCQSEFASFVCRELSRREEEIRSLSWMATAISLARNVQSDGATYYRNPEAMRLKFQRCLRSRESNSEKRRTCVTSKEVSLPVRL